MGKIDEIMKIKLLIIFFVLLEVTCIAQLDCYKIAQLGIKYDAFDFKDGRGKLMRTDTSITNKMKNKTFQLKKMSELNEDEKQILLKYNLKFNPEDTLLFYDWDILHKGKFGYFGSAVALVNISAGDSMIYTKKYLLDGKSEQYTPNQFKIIRMNEKDFILNDRIHPYLNINYYFKESSN